jgi:hypothetical protein
MVAMITNLHPTPKPAQHDPLAYPTRIMAIDPGAHGGLSVLYLGPSWVREKDFIADCPQNEQDLLFLYRFHLPTHIVIENVGHAVKGNGLVSAVKFARHCQMLQSTMKTWGLTPHLAAPNKWIPEFLGSKKPPFPISPIQFQKLEEGEQKKIKSAYRRMQKKVIQSLVNELIGGMVELNHADAVAMTYWFRDQLVKQGKHLN